MSLLHRLTVLIGLALVPAAGLEVVDVFRTREAREAEIQQNARRILYLLQAEQDRLVEGVRQLLVTLAQTDSVRSGDTVRCRELLARLRPEYPDYLNLFVTDAAGVVVCATSATSIGNDIAHRPHVRRALETGGFVHTGHIRRGRTGEAVLPFALPFRDDGHRVAGVVTALVDVRWLRGFLTTQPLPETASLTVADSDGIVIAQVPDDPELVGSPLPARYRELSAMPGTGQVVTGLDGVERIVAAGPLRVEGGLFLAIGIDRAAALGPVERDLVRSLGVIGLLMALALAGVWALGDRLLRRPVRALVGATERWRTGDLSARVPVDRSKSELAVLAAAFNLMADDIQGQARQREALHALEQKMAAVLASTTDGVFEVDRTWRVTFMNARARAMVAEGRDLTGARLWDVFPTAETGTFGEQYRIALERQTPVEFDSCYPPFNAWYAVRAFPTPNGLAVFFQDVTARRRIGERFRAIFEQAAVGIELVGVDGRFLDVNDKLCTILGYSREGLLAVTHTEVMAPADRLAEAPLIERLLDGSLPSYTVERRYRRRDGDTVWVRVTSSLARSEGPAGPARISIVEDITGRIAMEAALRHAKEEAERANFAKTKFLAAASHDLRQPLQSLFFFTAALAAHVHSGDGRGILTHIERGLDALKGLLDSLLDVSRLDAGMVTPTVEVFPVSDLTDQLRAAYEPIAIARGLRWNVDECPFLVRSDRTLLVRLLRNLVENALRYTESGEVAIECLEEGGEVRIVVRDTGIGIPLDQIDRIFDEFHQVGNTERDRQQGLGLGLAIVRRISRLLDHRVEVLSALGVGSSFIVHVPCGDAAARPAAVPAGDTTRGAGRFAVVVDDDAIVLMGLHTILGEWGYDVVAAGGIDQALREIFASGRKPDIVIADYRLRDQRIGTEAILAIRSHFGEAIRGVILTGETGADCQNDAARHGLTVIHKPVTPRQLAAALDRQFETAE